MEGVGWRQCGNAAPSNSRADGPCPARQVAVTWPAWSALAKSAVRPTEAACHDAIPIPNAVRRTCVSVDLKLSYELNSKAGSSLVRSSLRERYGLQGVTTQCEVPAEALHSQNLTSRGFAWFTLARDPVERFLSAVAEGTLAYIALQLLHFAHWTRV